VCESTLKNAVHIMSCCESLHSFQRALRLQPEFLNTAGAKYRFLLSFTVPKGEQCNTLVDFESFYFVGLCLKDACHTYMDDLNNAVDGAMDSVADESGQLLAIRQVSGTSVTASSIIVELERTASPLWTDVAQRFASDGVTFSRPLIFTFEYWAHIHASCGCHDSLQVKTAPEGALNPFSTSTGGINYASFDPRSFSTGDYTDMPIKTVNGVPTDCGTVVPTTYGETITKEDGTLLYINCQRTTASSSVADFVEVFPFQVLLPDGETCEETTVTIDSTRPPSSTPYQIALNVLRGFAWNPTAATDLIQYTVATFSGNEINAMCFNPLDNALYWSRQLAGGTIRLQRYDLATTAITNVGPVFNISAIAGGYDTINRVYIAFRVGCVATFFDTAGNVVAQNTIPFSMPDVIADVAFNPLNGKFYGVSGSGVMHEFTPTYAGIGTASPTLLSLPFVATTTDVSSFVPPGGGGFGASFSDSLGNFVFLQNSSGVMITGTIPASYSASGPSLTPLMRVIGTATIASVNDAAQNTTVPSFFSIPSFDHDTTNLTASSSKHDYTSGAAAFDVFPNGAIGLFAPSRLLNRARIHFESTQPTDSVFVPASTANILVSQATVGSTITVTMVPTAASGHDFAEYESLIQQIQFSSSDTVCHDPRLVLVELRTEPQNISNSNGNVHAVIRVVP